MRATVLIAMSTLVLGACAAPQTQCQRALTRDMRTVDSLIVETQTNLARGFRYVTTIRDSRVNLGVGFCSRRSNVGVCLGNDFPITQREAVAIDPEAERRKLDSLQVQRTQFQRQTCAPSGARVRI